VLKLTASPVSVDGENGEVMAVFAFPYADETAVPIEENWPLTACVVDAREPVTPAVVPDANDVADPAVRVGQMDVRDPGVEVQPEMDSARPATAPMGSIVLRKGRVLFETVIDKSLIPHRQTDNWKNRSCRYSFGNQITSP